MMQVVCAWCRQDLGLREGPVGEVSHGICRPCQKKHMKPVRRPFSVLLGLVGFAAWLLLCGVVGERDRQDAEGYEAVRAEIVATAPGWAVTQ